MFDLFYVNICYRSMTISRVILMHFNILGPYDFHGYKKGFSTNKHKLYSFNEYFWFIEIEPYTKISIFVMR